ncbi:MAG: hypothetical protein KDJ35_02265 [Alphaproteobacteria bacterium]|nr:hypothetical protein [Alphaproteobacteria bacterium]
MLKEKLETLSKQHPAYSEAILAVIDEYKKNPSKSIISGHDFRKIKGFEDKLHQIDVAHSILGQEALLKTVYRVIDAKGLNLSQDFNSYNELQDKISDELKEKINTLEVFPVPHYVRNFDI